LIEETKKIAKQNVSIRSIVMSLVGEIEKDLRKLGIEAKKKHQNDLKVVVERAIMRLQEQQELDRLARKSNQSASSSSSSNVNYSPRRSLLHFDHVAEIVQPLLTVLENLRKGVSSSVAASERMAELSVSALQRLVSGGALDRLQTRRLISLLRIVVVDKCFESAASTSTRAAAMHLKVLQIVTGAVTLLVDVVDECDDVAADALCVAFDLQRRRSTSVAHTASATLRQLLVMICVGSTTLAVTLLDDICRLTSGDAAKWMPTSAREFDANFGLELLEAVLQRRQRHGALEQADRRRVARVCPAIVNNVKLATEFGRFVRVQRIVAHFIVCYARTHRAETEVFLERELRLLRIDASATQLWYTALVLEVIARFCSSSYTDDIGDGNDGDGDDNVEDDDEHPLILHVFECYATGESNVAAALIESVVQFVQSTYAWPDDAFALDEPQRPLLQMLSSLDPPDALSPSYLVTLATRIVLALSSVAWPLSDARCAAARRYYERVWPGLLAALGLLLGRTRVDAALLALVLDGLRRLVLVTGALDMETPQQALLTAMVKFAEPVPLDQIALLAEAPALAEAAATMQSVHDAIASLPVPRPRAALTTRARCAAAALLDAVRQSGGNILAWPLALDAMALHFDASSSTAAVAVLATADDIEVLRVASDGIFEATARWSQANLDRLIGELLSRRGGADGFCLHALFALAMRNVHRLDTIWPSIVDPLCQASPPQTERIVALIRATPTRIRATSTRSRQLLEQQLDILERVSRKTHYRDCALTLDSLHFLLSSSSGTDITETGWQVVLSLLMSVAVDNERNQHMLLAFQSLELIVADFLPNLLPLGGCLPLAITAVGCFARQTALDSNTSLTAVQDHLRNIADFIASQRGDAAPACWINIFQELKGLATDRRADVRNGAIATLFKTVATHGRLLPARMWPQLFDDIVFPVLRVLAETRADKLMAEHLRAIRDRRLRARGTDDTGGGELDEAVSAASSSSAATADDDDFASEMLGHESEEPIPMLVHHSRNSAQKQWNETCVMAMRGLTRIFADEAILRTKILPIEKFDETYARLMAIMLAFVRHHSSEEVSLAALDALATELFPTLWAVVDGAGAALLWRHSWALLADAAAEPKRLPVPAVACARLCDVMVSLFDSERARFTLADYQRVLDTLPPLSAVCGERVFDILAHVSSSATPGGGGGDGDGEHDMADSVCERAIVVALSFLTAPGATESFAVASIEQLVALLPASPAAVQALTAELVMRSLGDVALRRHTRDDTLGLWPSAARALCALLRRGNMLDSVARMRTASDALSVWSTLCNTVEAFLFDDQLDDVVDVSSGGDDAASSTPSSLSGGDGDIDLLFVELVGDVLLCRAPSALRERLVDVLRMGTTTMRRRGTFARACYAKLFALCAGTSSTQLPIALIVAPALVEQCRDLLAKFVDDATRAPAMSAWRQQELLVVLAHLRALALHESIDLLGPNHALAFPLRHSSRRHLVLLLPTLVTCIALPQLAIRLCIASLIQLATAELGLI
jgi:Mon2/Sec7/BIG1-like, dimerisation and cyclophilin-binding domain/Mon2/Sec7/BIG1-like, HUS domain/C-terminal region of Mon2 protein